ncbi:hypothetical protein [Nocardioides bigeumensis]|uniref:Htaa protein n=1 Tax=Nocardioides bigeumensis TaxID=433657 RepID=A0ABN2XZQ4_9ACTN
MNHLPLPRRTVVRAAAWSLPVVSVAAAAPAYAGSPMRQLVPYGSVSAERNDDGTWSLRLSGVSFWVTGGDIAAGDLRLEVSFEPSTGFEDEKSLVAENTTAGTPFGAGGLWSTSQGVLLQCMSAAKIDAESSLTLSDGVWARTEKTDDVQRGRFVMRVSADGFAPVHFFSDVVPSAVPTLHFDPGASSINFLGTGALTFSGATVTATSGDVAAGALTMTVTYQPDPGFEDQISLRALQNPSGPSGWDFPYTGGEIEESLAYTLASGLTDGASLRIENGEYFDAAEWEDVQRGRFVITLEAPGFVPAVHTSASTVGAQELLYDPQGTAVTHGPDAAAPWELDLRGNAIVGGGARALAGTLRVMVTFEAADGTRMDMSILPKQADYFTGYENNSGPEVDTVATWTSTVDNGPGEVIPVLSPYGVYVTGNESHLAQEGEFVVTLEADGFPNAEARFPTPGF